MGSDAEWFTWSSSRQGSLMARNSGVSALVGEFEALELAVQVQEAVKERIAHGAPARIVQGTADELPPRDVLRILGTGRKSGRLLLRSDGTEGLLQFERGRVVWAGVDQVRGEEAERGEGHLRRRQHPGPFLVGERRPTHRHSPS